MASNSVAKRIDPSRHCALPVARTSSGRRIRLVDPFAGQDVRVHHVGHAARLQLVPERLDLGAGLRLFPREGRARSAGLGSGDQLLDGRRVGRDPGGDVFVGPSLRVFPDFARQRQVIVRQEIDLEAPFENQDARSRRRGLADLQLELDRPPLGDSPRVEIELQRRSDVELPDLALLQDDALGGLVREARNPQLELDLPIPGRKIQQRQGDQDPPAVSRSFFKR